MKWYIISIFLSLFYTFYVLLSKCLMKQFKISPEIIFVNAIIISALLCILFRRKDIIVPQPNVQYGLILIIAIILFYREYFIQLGTNNVTNMGIIDGLANHGSVLTQAINLCEDRGDCFLVFDPSGKTQTVAGVKSTVEGRNSSFAAAYYPWVQIRDASLGVNRYVPPSTVIAGVYHFNDVVGQPWFAPAGLNRGGIDSAVQAYKKLSQANRDALYDSNVNPIATFPGQGVTVFGQKTTQKKASALDRVNVRRLLINIKSFVARSSRNLVFEQNTTDLRDQFLNTVNPYLEQVQSNAGLQAFEVVMDDTNNTPETIDRNQLVGLIRLQPTRTAEFIVLDFVIEPSGAAFDG